MNLELIKKYEKEFLHMLHGGKVLMGKKDLVTNTIKWYPSVLNPFVETSESILIVIDDIYSTYRKALAEGKTVEFKQTEDDWWANANSSFCLHVDCYRIKPEEPKFKIGDYVRYIHTNSPKPLRIININCERYYFENAEIILRVDEIEKWEPKEGEVCIFWEEDSEYNRAIIGRLKRILSNGNYIMDYGSGCTVTYSMCMPFTGILPPHMKDSK